MLCAHEPSLDPRIRWEAEAAVRRFDVTVLGFAADDRTRGDVENTRGYCIIRLLRTDFSALRYFVRLKDVASTPLSIILVAALILVAPLLLLVEALVRRLNPMVRRFAGRAAAVTAARASANEASLDVARGQLVARVRHILNALAQRFSPATVLFWRAIVAMPDKPDIVHCNDLDTLLVGALAKRRYGCRVVYDAHEFYPYSDPAGRWLDIAVFSMLERFLIKKADAVVTVNPMLADVMREAYGLKHVYAVPNAEPWVDKRASPPNSPMRRLADGRIKFLFQGRFAPGRGIDELIRAWAGVDGDKAALFLRGPHNLWREAARGLAGELGLLDRSVYFLDAVSEDDLVSAAAEADVGIIPYRPLVINDRLSCPNKFSQYLHAGLLVIANDLPYVKLVLAEAQAGLFYDSTRLETLAEAVHRVVGDPELLRTGRKNALSLARHRFNWQTQGKTLYTLYDPPPEWMEPAATSGVALVAE